MMAVAQKKKAVFIIVDGIPYDVIKKLNTPVLDAIAAKGGMVQAFAGGEKGTYSETPTISANGYTSVLTGTWVHKHNVWDNDIKDINYNYPTIFSLLKKAAPEKTIGIFSTWLDNRTKLCGEGLPATGNLKFDYVFDGLELDTVQYPHDGNAEYIRRIDDTVSATAAKVIAEKGPDLSWVYLEHTDDMGHRYGDGDQFYTAVQEADRRIGLIWTAVQQRMVHNKEDWMVVVTTDHGRDSVSGQNHGGQTARERASWIVTNAKGLNERFTAGQVSLADIMPSIAYFMELPIPGEQARELDGTSFIGPVTAMQPVAFLDDNILVVQWKSNTRKGDEKIYVSNTNSYKTGGHDQYTLMATVPVQKEKVEIPLGDHVSGFYKIVIEAGGQMLTRWVVQQ